MASTVHHLVVEKGHVTILVSSGACGPAAHSLRVKHEVLSLRHHLVACQEALANIVSARANHNLLGASQIIHKLSARARTFIPLLLLAISLLSLVTHASVGEAVTSLLGTYALQLLAEGLGAVHFIISSLVKHNIRRAVLTRVLCLIEAVAGTLALSQHVLAVG